MLDTLKDAKQKNLPASCCPLSEKAPEKPSYKKERNNVNNLNNALLAN